MTTVFLVRHGETDYNKDRRIQGSKSDIPLNAHGEQQAAAIATRLSKEKLQAIYCSPAQRAVNTARAIAAGHRLEVRPDASFQELNVGQLEGVAVSEIMERVNKLIAGNPMGTKPARAMHDALDYIPFIGGESTTELQQRAWGGLQNIIRQHPGETIAVVTHQFVILTIICAVLDLPAAQLTRFRLGVASISAVAVDERGPRLLLFNETSYL